MNRSMESSIYLNDTSFVFTKEIFKKLFGWDNDFYVQKSRTLLHIPSPKTAYYRYQFHFNIILPPCI